MISSYQHDHKNPNRAMDAMMKEELEELREIVNKKVANKKAKK